MVDDPVDADLPPLGCPPQDVTDARQLHQHFFAPAAGHLVCLFHRGEGRPPDDRDHIRTGIKGHGRFEAADVGSLEIGQDELVRADFPHGKDRLDPGCLAQRRSYFDDVYLVDDQRGHDQCRWQGDVIQCNLKLGYRVHGLALTLVSLIGHCVGFQS